MRCGAITSKGPATVKEDLYAEIEIPAKKKKTCAAAVRLKRSAFSAASSLRGGSDPGPLRWANAVKARPPRPVALADDYFVLWLKGCRFPSYTAQS